MTAISKSRRLRPSRRSQRAEAAGAVGGGLSEKDKDALKHTKAEQPKRKAATRQEVTDSRRRAQASDQSARARVTGPAVNGEGSVRPSSGLKNIAASATASEEPVKYALNPGGDGPSDGGSLAERRRAANEAASEQDRRLNDNQWPATAPVKKPEETTPLEDHGDVNPMHRKPVTAAADAVMKDPSDANVARQEAELRAQGVDPGHLLKAIQKKARLVNATPPVGGEEYRQAAKEVSKEFDKLKDSGAISEQERRFLNRRSSASSEAIYAEDKKMAPAYKTLHRLQQLKDMKAYLKRVGGDPILNGQIDAAIKRIEGNPHSGDDGLLDLVSQGRVAEANDVAADIEKKNLTGVLKDDPAQAMLDADKGHWDTLDKMASIIKMLPGPYALPAVFMDSVKNAAKVDRGEMSNAEWWANLAIDTGMALGGKYISKLTKNVEGPVKQVADAMVDAAKAGATEFGKEAARIWADKDMSYADKMKAIDGAMRRSMAKAAAAMITGRAKALLKNATPEQKRKAVELMSKLAEKYGITPQVKGVLDEITRSAEG